jgi:hypothetical protein
VQDCGPAGCNADAKRCNQCVPSTSSCSVGADKVDHCGADGLPASDETCVLGCKADPAAHCAYLEPRYLPDICDLAATIPEFVVDNFTTIDTGADSTCTGGVVTQVGGPVICVVRYGSIHVTASGTLTTSGLRALALVADSAIRIEGVLDVSANGTGNGPGGGTIASGEGAGSDIGGGGAGFGTAGGNGGSRTVDGGGGRGGAQATNPALLTVLVGGTRPTRASGEPPHRKLVEPAEPRP